MLQFTNTALSGLVSGMIFAAFALALVLIWRSTRILNFAQAPMAVLTTYVALVMIEDGRSYWLAFVVALVCGLVLGAVVERLVIRPVEGKPDINAVILTLGLFIVFKSGAEVIFGTKLRTYPPSFGVRGISLGDTTIGITTSDFFTIGAVLATMAVLVALFRFTDLGLKMRAAANNQEVARLLGVKVGAMLTLGLGASRRRGLAVRPADRQRRPGAALLHGLHRRVRLHRRGHRRARVAAGRRRRWSAARCVPQLRQRLHRGPAGRPGGSRHPDGRADLPPRRSLRRDPGKAGLMNAITDNPTGRVMELWRGYPLVRHLVTAVIALFVVIFVLNAVDDFQSTKLTEMAYLAIAAGGLTLLTGLNGQISLGHGALMAFGAYTAALLYDERDASPPLILVVLASVLVTVLVGILIGIAAARLHGPYLAGATLTLAVAVPGLGNQFKETLGGDQGLRLFPPEISQWATDIAYYLTGSDPSRSKYIAFLAWATLIIVFFLLANLASSRVGRRWAAVRDDEVAAEIAGIDLTRARVSAFVVSAAAAGAAGAMFALAQRTVTPLGFSLNLSLTLLAVVVLGGLGSLTGAIVLSGVLVFLPQIVMDLGSGAADIDATRASQMSTLAFGLVMVLVILLAPRGLAGGVRSLNARIRGAITSRRTPSSPSSPSSPTTSSGSPSSTETAHKGNSNNPTITKKGTS